VLELGGNDGLRGQPIETMRANLARMIELSLEHGARVLLTGIQIPPNYGPTYTGMFAAAYSELAMQYDVTLIDFLGGVALHPDLMQPDNIHPNAEGQKVLFANVWPVLAEMLRAQ
jgi:acyl-CoA thioesterase I